LRIFFTPRQQDMFVANKVISEWKPSFRSFSEIFSFSGLMYKGLIVVTFIALLSRIKKVCRTQAVLFLSFLLISLVAVRFRDLFALVAACVYAQASLDCEGRVIQAGWKARPPITRLIKIICGLILFSALLWRGIDFFTSQVEMQGKKIRRYGAGIDIENSPEGALRFIDSNNLAGHIYNSTSFGSYMIWRDYPRRKVFMDMRADLYCLSGVFQKLIALNQRENWERLVKQYDIAVVMLNTTFNEDRNGSVTRHILASNKWACVYLDGPSVVFLKKDKFPAEFLKQHEIRIFEKLEIGPDDFGEYLLRGPIPQNRFSRSVLARVNNFPEPLDCVTKGNWFINIESFDQALLEYKKALKINPLLDGADFWIGYCFYKKARFDYADIFINRALKASFSNPDVLLLAAGLAKTKDIQVAFNYYKQAVRYNPRHVKARELLADFAFRENFYKEALDSYLWLSNKNPADIDYRLKIGVLYGRIGKLADSKRMFEGVIVRQPDNLDAHLNLAIASRYLGLMRLCRQELEKVISLDKGNLQAKSYLLELERSGF
ncbi:MAG: tetratricopeptide repeat protein, partial [Candidatus Omnitrophica bacterium]|nr:tetratricopeptide repeat protein [Candidatus Omnitrophota bacterium]